MNIMPTGNLFPTAGKALRPSKPKLREALSHGLHSALTATFAPFLGGSKALAAASERDPKTSYNWLHGKTVMSAVDFLMVAFRCPRFRAEVRKMIAKVEGRAGAVRSKFSSLRLRFRRRKAVAP